MPSGEKKNLVRREVFSGYGGCRPKFGRMAISLFCSVIGVQGLSGGHAEWSFIFCSMSKVWWVSAKVRPNGHILLRLFVRCRVSVSMSGVNVPRSCRAEMAEWPSSLVFIC